MSVPLALSGWLAGSLALPENATEMGKNITNCFRFLTYNVQGVWDSRVGNYQ